MAKKRKQRTKPIKSEEDKEYVAEGEEKELLKDYKEKIRLAKEWQDNVYEKLIRYYFLYRGLQEEEEYPWRNNISLPIAFSIIETLIPRVVLNQPKITLKGFTDDAKRHLKTSKAILEHDFYNKDFQLELIDWFKRAFIYGTAVCKVMFRKIERNVPKEKIKKKIKRFFRRKGTRKIEQFVEIKSLEPFHFKIDDPQTNYIKNADWLIHDTYITETELKDNREDIYNKNIKYVKAEEIKDDFASSKWEVNQLSAKKRGRILDEGITSIGSSQSFDRQRLVKISEEWMKSSKEHPLGRVVTFANDKVIIRDDINPYWYVEGEFPFVEIKDHPVPGEFYAVGEVEAVESLIYERNHIRNRRLDSSEASADQMWWVDPEAEMDENELVWRPGGIVGGRQGEDFGVIERGQPYTSTAEEEKLVKSDIEESIGQGEASRGVGQKYETATGLLALINEANQRFALKIKLIGELGLARLFKMILQMEQFEASGDRVGRITGKEGEEFIEVKADDIRSDYHFKVAIDPNPLLNKILDVETLNKVAQTLSVAPEGKAFELVQKEIIKVLDILSEEEIEEIFGEKKANLGGVLPRRLQKRKIPGPGSAEKTAMVAGGGGTAGQVQPTRPGVQSPPTGNLPKKIRRR